MLDVSKIAFFLLSTAGLNGFAEQKYPTFFDSRTLPIKQTWGAFFPHLHFVFGNNPADYRFLQKRCTLERTIGEPINPSAKQTLVRNATDLYSCPVTPSEWKWNASQPISSPYTSPVLQAYNSFAANRLAPLRALYHANCSGKYFGLGPSCRCQESMRYYLTEPAFRDFDWFVFMDDDLYFRPYALLSFLDRVQRNTSLSSQPLAMIAGSGLQGFRQLKNKALASGHHDCTHQVVYRFGYAQPAFFNRKTMTKLSLAVHSNAMTGLHKYWGGSHDSLLGMLLWMHGIPTYSILNFYHSNPIHVLPGNELVNAQLLQSSAFVFHRIMSRVLFRRAPAPKGSKGKMVVFDSIASQYDMCSLLGEQALYDGRQLTELALLQIAAKQAKLGEMGALALERLPQDTIHMTAYRNHSRQLDKEYVNFTPNHCALLAAAAG